MSTLPSFDSAFSITLTDIPLAEFDLGGVLYHANYFRLLERLREAFLADRKIPYSSLVKQNRHFAIAESQQKFIAPVFYGQEVRMSLVASDLRRASLKFHYLLQTSDSGKWKTVHYAWTKSAFVAVSDGNFSTECIPDQLRAALESILIEPV